MSLDIGANSARDPAEFSLSQGRGALLPRLTGPRRAFSWYGVHRLLEVSATRWLLSLDDAERAHNLALYGLRFARILPRSQRDDPLLASQAFGLAFPNPIGVAAGLDKNAQAVDAVLHRGFGFAEVGTLTPRRQDGHEPPRVFRLLEDEAIINRFGFNNCGHEDALLRLLRRAHRPGIVGINIGANKDSLDRMADYVMGIEVFAPVASYFAVNISSPNTAGLRDLQEERAFDDLLARVLDARDRVSERVGRKPIILKIAPDLALEALDALVAVARRRKIDGMIVSNTTVSRPIQVRDPLRLQTGGLSGCPLFNLSTRMLAETFVRVEGDFPLIGAGGIDSGKAAWQKIRAGATLLQLYTSLIYKGPPLLDDIKSELVELTRIGQYKNISDVVGCDADSRISEPWPE
jgi:dihydroorotate dehydrogenase